MNYYKILNLSEVEVPPLSFLLSPSFSLIVFSHESPTISSLCPTIPQSTQMNRYKFQLELNEMIPIPYESALSLIDKYRRKFPESSYVCYIEPLYLFNRDIPIRFIGFSVSHYSTQIFHILYYDSDLPDYLPVENSLAKGIYQLPGPAETLCKLEISWEYPLSLNSLPGINCTSCKVIARGGFGDSPLLGNLQRDVLIIKSLLIDEKNFNFPSSCTDNAEKFIETEIKIKIEGLNQYRPEKNLHKLREERITQFCGMQERGDTDITDRIWDLLKTAHNYDEMKRSFLRIIENLREKRFFPVISYRNGTRLGVHFNEWSKLLQMNKIEGSSNSYSAERSWFFNSEHLANDVIDIVAEIGLHKLGQDFCDYLVSGGYFTAFELEWFVQKDLCNKIECLEKLEKLLKLLQITIILKSSGLKVHVIGEALRPLIVFYKENDGFPLIVHTLNGGIDLPCLNSYQLDCWEVIQHTKKDFCNNTTKYSYINNEWWKVDIDIYEDNNV